MALGMSLVVACVVAWRIGYSSVAALVSYGLPALLFFLFVQASRTEKHLSLQAAADVQLLRQTLRNDSASCSSDDSDSNA